MCGETHGITLVSNKQAHKENSAFDVIAISHNKDILKCRRIYSVLEKMASSYTTLRSRHYPQIIHKCCDRWTSCVTVQSVRFLIKWVFPSAFKTYIAFYWNLDWIYTSIDYTYRLWVELGSSRELFALFDCLSGKSKAKNKKAKTHTKFVFDLVRF